MSEFAEIVRKQTINPDTGEPYTDEEWYFRDAEIAAALEQAAFEERNRDWQRRKESLIDAGLTQRHLGELYGNKLAMNPAITKVLLIASDGVTVMSGNVGCGKTLAAHAWLLDSLNVKPMDWSARGIRFITASWFARASRYESEKFDICKSVRKLVIDDIGVEYADNNKSFLVDLDELLDLRWGNGRATLLTTNLVVDDFKDRYGKRIYDRSRGENRWMNVKHESMRGS